MNEHLKQKSIMIIAGEKSGDLHGSRLIRAMRAKYNNIDIFGIGGEALKKEKVNIKFDYSRISVVGLTEIFSKIPSILKGLSIAKDLLKKNYPDLLILIDFPDFNLHIAKTAKKLNIPVLYYISPQIWAWRLGRIKKIKKLVNHMAVILPFEESYYKKYNVPATYVGHPLLDFVDNNNAQIPKKKNSDLTIGLLPGSRNEEVKRLLPEILRAVKIINKKFNKIKFIISLAQSVNKCLFKNIMEEYKGNTVFEIESKDIKKIFEKSYLIIVASGTVTLEAAIAGIPMVILYKTSMITSWVAKMLIKVKYIGLANLIAEKEIVPELIQENATPEKIADKVYDILNTPERVKNIKKEFLHVKKILGGPGASFKTAEIALQLMKHNHNKQRHRKKREINPNKLK